MRCKSNPASLPNKYDSSRLVTFRMFFVSHLWRMPCCVDYVYADRTHWCRERSSRRTQRWRSYWNWGTEGAVCWRDCTRMRMFLKAVRFLRYLARSCDRLGFLSWVPLPFIRYFNERYIEKLKVRRCARTVCWSTPTLCFVHVAGFNY